jgi:hypothetical protein
MKNERIFMVYPGWNEQFTGHVLHNEDGYIAYVNELPQWAKDREDVKPGVFGKVIPIEHITPELVKRWYQLLVGSGPEVMKEAIADTERECFIKDAIQEHEQRKGMMQSKPGHFTFNLSKGRKEEADNC